MPEYDRVMSELSSLVEKAAAACGFGDVSMDNQILMRDSGFSDIACTIAFKIAKQTGKEPNDIASEICNRMGKTDYIESVSADNGFINFTLKRDAFSDNVVREVLECRGTSAIGDGRRIIVEYPSVNPNKPWHVGHLRNALIGDSMSRIYGACGYSVEREDYIDDMGLQVVELLWGLVNLGGTPGKKYDHWLGELYVKVNSEMQGRDIKGELSRMIASMEQGGTHEAELAREMTEKCVHAQYETAFDYGVYHDVLIWESDIVHSRMLDRALELLKNTGAVRKEESGKYEGCIAMDLGKASDLPKEMQGLKESVKVLVRSNGAATYAAKDIAFHMWKFGLIEDPFLYSKFADQPDGSSISMTCPTGSKSNYGGVDMVLNVIDMQQAYEQNIVRLAFSLIGRNDLSEKMVHLAYNVVELESGAFSGRKGTWMGYTADELLSEAMERAAKLISDRLKLDEKERRRVTGSVALSAIKFEMLKVSPERKIVFSWDKALTFNGISGPYCQYMYARAARILESVKEKTGTETLQELTGDEEFSLIKLMSRCSYTIGKACRENRSNVLTEYAGQLASQFSKFYESVPVIKADTKEQKAARLALVRSFMSVMKETLSLLGIEVLERM